MTKKKKKIGILTAGGDCPGLNAAIRGVGKTAIVEFGMEVIGFRAGYSGLIHNDYLELKESQLSGILTLGGTILGTSREKPFKNGGADAHDKPDTILQNYNDLGLDALVCIGGNGTMKTANMLSKQGLNVVGIPKTIDNDVWGTDITFGFESAVEIATEAIDRLHTTANSHQRVMIIEVMGHNAGWLALYAGTAGGGDIILLPELPYNLRSVCKKVESRYEENKPYSIVVVAEGIERPEKRTAANYIAEAIGTYTGLETRETVLGYIQRGGSPSPFDRILATRYGSFAAQCIADGNFGTMVSVIDNKTVAVPLSEVGGKTRLVRPDDPLVTIARRMGISFGDEYLK
ncbi:MAG: 6-phosphofructokinase [Prolixibacteraceae bacterium]|jgi:6-phosphofructokinase 1|nr:6-phosphofructokinase [Prolixibacteraceae bacterium]NLX27427.1 6-phosphofructokinase [Bacteroidales bacterium]HOY51215.1 ATP-dependent 6-phosphofructokinase [Prolixibacteraceae bacterium]HPJ79491.1 ATP-dependent 6-phosphofructokinase [Prolixibacteraceae bacterium]HRV90134.1 ATP-dependent 6-phosphofructokinase [Prolixibacteraceae bacterium]